MLTLIETSQYNLKNGDTIYVVKKLDAIDDDGEGDDGLGPVVRVTDSTDSNMITVVVPENARAGTRLLINPPGRDQMSVIVPAGLRSGDRFQVRLPPRTSSNNNSNNGRLHIGGNEGQIMQVTCPRKLFVFFYDKKKKENGNLQCFHHCGKWYFASLLIKDYLHGNFSFD